MCTVIGEDRPMTAASQNLLSGAAQFARYAFPPNDLGYCGPAGAEVLLESGQSAIDREAIADRARQFEGAWVYLEIIAAAAGIDDPLDARVVEAYWIGNDLLDRVDPASCAEVLVHRFVGQSTSGLTPSATKPAAEALPHHGFHVFTIYPWVGMLGGSNDPVAVSVLDNCRIRSGEVTEVAGDELQVLSRPLTWDGHALGLGAAQLERVRWADAGRSLLGEVRPGQQVALHWSWACDQLTPEQLGRLEHYTRLQLDTTNTWLATSA